MTTITEKLSGLLPLLALTACPLQIDIGDNPQDPPLAGSDSSDSSDSSGEPTTDAPEPTTGDEPVPAVCGDGLVGADEPCDDGNDDPHDGCAADCTRTGVLQWQYEPADAFTPAALAIDATGVLIVVGEDQILAVDPDGAELWRRTIADESLTSLALDDAGRIHVGSELGVVHGLDVDGAPLWHSGAPSLPDDLVRTAITGVAHRGGTTYALATRGTEPDEQKTLLRRIDGASGTLLTETVLPTEWIAYGRAIAVDADQVVIVGMLGEPTGVGEPLDPHGFVAAFDHAGALLSFVVDPAVGPQFSAVASTIDGGFVIGGWSASDPTAVVRAVDPAMSELWTRTDQPQGVYRGVAAGLAGELAVAGTIKPGALRSAIVQRLAPDGTPMWTSQFESSHEHALDSAFAVAVGPGFVAAIGREWTDGVVPSSTWIRRFALD